MTDSMYEDGAINSRLENVTALYDEDGSVKFVNDSLSSSNFDGSIFSITASVGVSQVSAGQLISIESSSAISFYPIIKVEEEDPVLSSPYTGAHYIYYFDGNEITTASYSSSAASVVVKYDDWDNKDLGTAGWTITSNGNAIFSNIAARGRIEATSGFIGDAYSGWEISANLLSNASVGFYAPSAFSSADIAIFSGSPFTGRATAPFRVNYGGNLFATGASISGDINAQSGQFTGSVTAQTITASNGNIGGWTLSSSGLVGGSGTNTVGIISVPNSSSIAIFAGNATASAAPFQVTNLGKMTASNAEISGQITSASITSTFGIIAGWTLSSSALTGGSGTNTVGLVSTPQADNISIYAGSTTPSSAPFRVTKTGSVFATNATITGDSVINGTNIGNGGGNIASNLRVGASALGFNTTGVNNIALGDSALFSNTTGVNNLAIGYQALQSVSSGGANIALGTNSLQSLTTTTQNIAVGVRAMTAATGGTENIAIGTDSASGLISGDYNIAIGDNAFRRGRSGTFNMAIGQNALSQILGSGNVALGAGALGQNTSGSFNIAIGHQAGNDVSSGSRNIYLGYNPGATLTSNITYLGVGNNLLGLRIDADQEVNTFGGLNNTGGQLTSQPTYDNAAVLATNVHITAAGVFRRNSSTQRIKHDIIPLSASLSPLVDAEKINTYSSAIDYRKVLDIAPVQFKSTQEDVPWDRYYIGFIAEDIADKIPEIATYDLDGIPEYYDVNGVVATMLAVVQDQQKMIENLEERVLQLETLIERVTNV